MPSIDERVVAMAFENQVFENRVSTTIATLGKLDTAVKNISGAKGLEDIEKAGNKVTLNAPMSALDKLKAKLGRSGEGATQGFNDIERASNKVTLEGTGRAIDKTQSKLDHLGAGSTFNDIEKAADQVQLNGISKAVEAASHQFTVLKGAASVALGNIATMAASKAFNFAKGFGVGPIIDGLHEYETNLKAIQTVQANTDQPLSKINKSLTELNRYSDQTIYNFGEMAKNIGTFTAAGVDLKTATSSIKGIANMAALSGSSSQQAATAMYQLSQAISSGKVGLQDWNSVVNAGMGGKKLQNALAQTGIAMGKIGENSVKLEGPMKKLTINGQSFRESIMAGPGKQSWLESDILVNTLATLDGRFSKAAMSAELTKNGLKKYTAAQIEAKIADNRASLEKKNGVKYTDEQFKALMKLSDSAFKSATEVKTLGQVFDVAKETIGSGWSASFQNIFGNLKEAKKLFTGMSGTINGFINANALARNNLLAGWKELGGRADVIQGLKNVFNVLFDVMGKIGKAFREIFPKKTAQDLADMSEKFLIFTARLNNAPEVIDNIARIFKGFFAVLHIGWSIIKGVIGVIGNLLGVVGKGSGGFLNFAGGVGDFLVAIDKALTQGGLLNKFFAGLTAVLKLPVKLIIAIASGIGSLFSGGEKKLAQADELGRLGEKLTPLEKLITGVKNAWEKLSGALGQFKQMLEPWFSQMVEKFKGFGDIIANAFKNMDFDKIMSFVQTGLIAGLLVTFKKALGDKGIIGSLKGTLDSITGVLGGVTGKLEVMQKNIQARTLIIIASAIAVLAGAIFVLSKINAEDLAKSMTAIAVGLGELMGSMKLMMAGMGKLGLAQMPIIAGSLVVFAGAVVVLAAAMKIFGTMKWEELAKGLVGIGGGLAAIGVGMKFLGPGTVIQGPAILILAIALNALAFAVKQFASLKWEELGRGLAGVLGVLIALGASTVLFGPSLLLIGPGLVGVAFAMNLLAGAVAAFGSMDPKKLGLGLFGVGLALAAIGVGIMLIPPTIGVQAAGLFILAAALTGIAVAVSTFGAIGLFDMIKGLIGMAGALIILSVGLIAMTGSLPGAAALIVAAGALALLAPTLSLLGNLSWGTILKGLATMALTLGVLAIVGALAAPGLFALGVALLPLAEVFLVTSAAILLFAKALSLLGESGGKGIAVMIASVGAFIAIMPKLLIDFVKGLVEVVGEVAKIAPKVVDALVKILNSLIDVVIKSAPRLGEAITVLITQFLKIVDTNAPKIMDSGIKLLGNLLSGISKNISQVTTKVSEIIVKFLNALAAKMPSIVSAGFNLLNKFLGGIISNLPKLVATVARIITTFLNNVTANIPRVVSAAGRLIIRFINALAQQGAKIISAGVNLILKLMTGIGNAIPRITSKAVEVATKFATALGRAALRLVDVGFRTLINFLNGLAKAIRERGPELRQAGWNVADAILDGMVDGFKALGGKVIEAAGNIIKSLPNAAKKLLGIHSPSKVFHDIGANVMVGFANGIVAQAPLISISMGSALKQMVAQTGDAKALGGFLGKEFMNGLTGAVDPRSEARQRIEGSFDSLRGKLKEETDKLREQLNSDREKLKAEVEKDHPSAVVVRSLSIDVRNHTALLNTAKRASARLMNSLIDEKKKMVSLAATYDSLGRKIEKAQAKLEEITQARDSVRDQYNVAPDIDSLVDEAAANSELTAQERADKARKAREAEEKRNQIDQVALYKKAMQDRIIATQKYAETLEKLKELGLDDATYKKLLAEGTKDQKFADQLLSGGKAAVDEVNALSAQMLATSTKLANDTTKRLYNSGVNAAQGLVDGLKAKQEAIQVQMNNIAKAMVKAIKKQLGIRSPSKVMGEVGKSSAQGVIKGLQAVSVANAAGEIGDKAVTAMTDSLAAASEAMASEIDPNPTITPILDLSQVRKEAQTLGPLTSGRYLIGSVSSGQASAASQEVMTASRSAPAAADIRQPMVHLEQNNYSPDPLSTIELYRQTNNQLSQLKTSLGMT